MTVIKIPKLCLVVLVGVSGSGKSTFAARHFRATDEFGLPVRYPWAQDYRGKAVVVYGHTPVPEAVWVNNTICLDTGCVFGGRLTALRYPERELVSVAAQRVYYQPARPLTAVPSGTSTPDAGAPSAGDPGARAPDGAARPVAGRPSRRSWTWPTSLADGGSRPGCAAGSPSRSRTRPPPWK